MTTVLRWIVRLGAVALGMVLLLQLWYFACIGWYRFHDPSSTAFMRSHMALVREKDPSARMEQRWVPYAQISDHLKRAVITAEDGRFVEHDGVDWDAISKAYENNQRIEQRMEAADGKGRTSKARMKGGSTITQQLAKNLFLSGDRSYLRKGQELVIAYMLEFWLSKRRILEIYLNVIEWGNGIFGAEAAARHYFGVPASQLGPSQAAQLAVMLPNPRGYDTRDRGRGSRYLAKRSAVIARWMGDAELP